MSVVDPSRLLAADRLIRVEADDAWVARLSGDDAPPEADRRAVALVAGVTRWRRWLDWALGRYLRQPLASLDPPLRQALRIGAYELLVEAKPAHAAVGEAVGIAREMQHKGAAGLANAVLRKLARDRDAGDPFTPRTNDSDHDLAVRFSHPTWMVRRWREQFGREATEDLLQANNRVPQYTLRVNRLATTPEALLAELAAAGADPEASLWSEDLISVRRLGPVVRDGFLARGLCAVQDEAAALVVAVLDPQPGETVLDAAAAPGGKAIYAAERMQNTGRVTAVDVNSAKTHLIRKAARAHGATIVEPLARDLTEWEADEQFDRVLLDAPCSGTGVLAKRADMRWRRSPEDLDGLAELQDRLLDAASSHVRPGGLLVYSTCSLEPEENIDRVRAFLARSPEFTLEPVGEVAPEAMRTADGTYAALPHVHDTDGAWAARLRRSPASE